jgi:hypothetical protein
LDDHDTGNPQQEPFRDSPEDPEFDQDIPHYVETVVEQTVEEALLQPLDQQAEKTTNPAARDL